MWLKRSSAISKAVGSIGIKHREHENLSRTIRMMVLLRDSGRSVTKIQHNVRPRALLHGQWHELTSRDGLGY